MIKLVATDLDGTLLRRRRHRHRPHPRGARRARRARRHRGLRDRPPDPLDGAACGSTSATTAWRSAPTAASCTTSRAGPVLEPAPIPREVGLAGGRPASATALPGSTFALEKTDRLRPRSRRSCPQPRTTPRADAARSGRSRTVFGDDVVKLLALHQEHRRRASTGRRSRQLVGHVVTTTWSSVGPLVEMSAAGVTKATHAAAAVRRARHRRRGGAWPSGTCPTTSTMLRWAGHVVRDGERAPDRARGGRPHRSPQRRGRRRAGARGAVLSCS